MKAEHDEDELIARRLSRGLTEEEKAAFDKKVLTDKRFKERAEIYEELWDRSSDLSLPAGLSGKDRWEKLSTTLSEKEKVKKLSFVGWKYAAIVALLAAAVAAIFLVKFPAEERVVSAKNGERKQVVLPDRSVVILNANSEISYMPSGFSKERRITLSGEAYFDVSKNGAPFIVKVPGATVEVLGTTFNVRTFDQKINVACSSGKVRVSAGGSNGKTLETGDGIQVVDSHLTEIYRVDIENVAAWRSGKLYFKEMPISDVLAEMERYFAVKIRSERKDLRKMTFTGKFDRPQLENMLKTICLSAGLDFEIENKTTVNIK